MTAAPEPLSLSAFLLARYAEEDALARAASPGPWRALTTGARGGDHWYICDDEKSLAWIAADDGVNEGQREPDATFIARHDPAHVLATVAAHRRIVEEFQSTADWSADPDCTEPWVYSIRAGCLLEVLQMIAQPYASHPDFRDEWRTVSPFEAAARSLASIEQPEEQRG